MRAKLFTIAPHAPFLPTLAKRLADGTLPCGTGRFGLADVTIFLPTRRARAALAQALLDQSGAAAVLPDLRTLGETDAEEEPFLPPFPAPELPPIVAAQRRRLVLAELVEGWISARGKASFAMPGPDGALPPPTARDILGLADALADLIDDCTIAQTPPSAILDLDLGELAGNWQEALEFLRLALDHWPRICAERGEIDAASARNLRLSRQARAVPLVYADRPVIVAGSTGSIPATADFIAAIAKLPRGAVVLPGLDTTLTAHDHSELVDETKNPHGHPQYSLMRLLRRLGAGPGEVVELAEPPTQTRTQLVRHALASADRTALWPVARSRLAGPPSEQALDGMALLAARNDEEQARAIAIAARSGLAAGKRVGIITPDRVLARRVAAELARFDIRADDSAGTPLYQSAMGRFVRQAVAVVSGDWHPVDVMALLRHSSLGLGMSREALQRHSQWLEMGVLRGQRPPPGPEGLRRIACKNHAGKLSRPHLRLDDEKLADVLTLIAALEQALSPLSRLAQAGTPGRAAELAAALAQACGQLRAGAVFDHPLAGEAEFSLWHEGLVGQADLGPSLPVAEWSAALYALMAGVSVRPPMAARDDISILGLIEARLLSFDVTILAGLNEGVWPDIADPGPWLSRSMAIAAGLAPPEKRHGQMAHDFQMALGGEEVVLCWSTRRAGAPTDPSRLVQRLTAFMGAELTAPLLARGMKWCAQAIQLDAVSGAVPAPRPAPRPPAHLRPRTLSVTEIEPLIRSPYDLYARYVLELRPLEPLGHDPDFAERGTLVHDILARFIEKGGDPKATDALNVLMAEAETVFEALATLPSRRAGWRRRFKAQAEAFIEYEVSRDAAVASRHVERAGRLEFTVEGTPFVLRGRADRIDVMTNGQLEILDYKTGSPPDAKTMKALLAPQLLAEAQMALQGAFTGIAPARAQQLTYLKLGFGPKALEVTPFKTPDGMDLDDAVARAFNNLQQHISAYLLSDRLPLSPLVLPDTRARFSGDYDHLARVEEWALLIGAEEAE